MTEYRKRFEGNDAWHWYSNCRNFPKASYDRRMERPTEGVLCHECQMIEAAGNYRDVVRPLALWF